MSSLAKNTKATVIPCLRYRNAPAAIEWLYQTFGFEKHLVVPGEGDAASNVTSRSLMLLDSCLAPRCLSWSNRLTFATDSRG